MFLMGVVEHNSIVISVLKAGMQSRETVWSVEQAAAHYRTKRALKIKTGRQFYHLSTSITCALSIFKILFHQALSATHQESLQLDGKITGYC